MPPERFSARTSLAVPASEAYAWHLRPGAFERLGPPWERIEVIERDGGVAEGSRVVLRMAAGPLRFSWISVHRGFVEGRQFQDVQEKGPFRSWVHTHRFVPEGTDRSRLEDEIEYDLGFEPIGRLARGTVRRKLERMFRYRHAVTQADLTRHHGSTPIRVAISGASGLIGSALAALLRAGGHTVIPLVRRTRAGPEEIAWDPAAGHIEAAKLEGLDAVVHLAGENIAAGRWSPAQKARIRDSRLKGTRLLAESLAGLERPPRVLVSGSAIGYYGDRGDEPLDERSRSGSGFLAETCREWEAALEPAERAGVRVVRLRTGIVLSPRGGALAKMLPPFRLGLGGRLGDGRQVMSWIAHEDLLGVLHHSLFCDGLAGPVNAVAPAPVRNAEFTRVLGRVLKRPTVVPVPQAAIRALLGEMGRELLLSGARILPRRLEETAFRFRYPQLEDALRFELGRPRSA